ncbi:MAG: enoyl-CoA hydratase/isomerase family protein [Phycisphaerales bacterium]
MIRTFAANLVTTISLDRPEKRNALTPLGLAGLERAIRAVVVDARAGRTHALLLTGEGDTFCAGFDLTLCKDDDSVLEKLLRLLSSCVRALREVPCPVVASAHGAAIAGGCALLGGCDVVVTHGAARLGYPVVPLGISPAVSGPTLASLVGPGHARALLMGARVISGEEALRVGLAHECADSVDACRSRAATLAADLSAKPPHALAATKRWLLELDAATPGRVDEALAASLSIVNSPEQHALLPAVWTRS